VGKLGIVLISFLSVCPVYAEPPSACDRPSLEDLEISAEQLCAIAETCKRPEVAKLYYKRAYLREILDEYDQFNAMISADQTSQANFEAYRILIGLAEAFAAEALSKGDVDVLSRLSRTYDRYIEIAELRLKGYDLIANRMERDLHL
jgi:hypothetical protein